MKKRLCYIFSDVDSSLLIDANIRHLNHDLFEVKSIFLSPSEPKVFRDLREDGYDVEFYQCRGKIDIVPLIITMYRRLRKFKPDIIHTHLFHASIVGLTAGWLRRVRTRVNTRHHSVEAHLYHPHAVLYDRFLNKISTHVVAITDLVADVLINTENVPREKVTVIHHGLDLMRFCAARERSDDLRSKYGLNRNFPVIGVISRFIHWKGIQYIVPAFREIRRQYPQAKLVLANASGSYESEVRRLLETLEHDSFCLIPFEHDVLGLYKSFDVFVHVPIGRNYEAFGQVYIEALAMGVPSIFTMSGVANDFIENGANALVVDFRNFEEIKNAIDLLLVDSAVRTRLSANGIESISSTFDVRLTNRKLEALYSVLHSGVR